jgi:hypothetical protein
MPTFSAATIFARFEETQSGGRIRTEVTAPARIIDRTRNPYPARQLNLLAIRKTSDARGCGGGMVDQSTRAALETNRE